MKNIKQLRVVVLILFLIVLGVMFFSKMWREKESVKVAPTESGTPLVTRSGGPHQRAYVQKPSPTSPPLRSAVSQNERDRISEDFQKKFGTGLKLEFSSDGYLLSIKGRIGDGSPSDFEFTSTNSEAAIRRAREILSAAEPLIGVQPNWPLGSENVNTGPVSAQVYFRELHSGLPVEPLGGVKMDLGPKGELIGLGVDYFPAPPIVNQFRITPGEARARALAAMSGMGVEEGAVGEGVRVLWIMDGKAFYSYRFNVVGYLVVIDGQSGEVLIKKNTRQY